MGFRIEAPKQDGNARFNSLKVNLNENNSATRTVVADEQGNFYYGAGGTGGASGTSGTSGTSGADGASGASGTSGTSGTGFNAIADPLQGRVLLSDGSINNASASLNLFYDTGSFVFQITGSTSVSGSVTSSLDAQISGLNIGSGPSGSLNIIFGATMLSASTSGNRGSNIAIGSGTLRWVTNNRDNIGIGFTVMNRLVSGNQNIGLGTLSFWLLESGSQNVGIGNNSLRSVLSGSLNTAIGYYSGGNIVTGSFNTLVGAYRGEATMSNNIILSDGQANIKYRWDTIQNNLYGNTSISGSLFVTGSSPRAVLTDFIGTTQNITASIVAQDNLTLSSNSNETIRLSYKNLIANRTNAGYSSNLRGNETNIYGGSTDALGRLTLTGDLITVNRTDTSDISSYTSNLMYGSYVIMNQGNSAALDSAPKYSALARSYYSNQNIYQGNINIAEGFRHLSTIGALNVGNTLVTNYYGFRSSVQVGWTSGIYSSSITNHYGLYLDTPSVNLTGNIINRWGVYAPDPIMKHHISGTLSIGTIETGSYQLHVVGNTGISGSLTTTGSVLFPSLTESPQSNVVLIDTTTGQLYYTGSTSFNVVSSSYPIAVTGSTLYSVNPNAGTNFNANQNIFLGEGSGQDSQYTTFAVSLGYQAGYQSNFSQSYTDNLGDFTASANYIGFQAGYQATQSTDANFIGFRAGYQSDVSNGANFIGDSAGYLSKNGDNSNFIGRDAGGSSNSLRYSNAIGRYAGWGSLNVIDSNFIGYEAGDGSKNILSSNFIGEDAGMQTSNSTGSNFIGYYTGHDTTSSYSTLIGWKAGANPSRVDSIGSNNIIIGTGITLEKDRKDSINIGGIIFGTGSYLPSDVFLTPMNSGSANGRIGINQPNPQYTLDVSGSLNTVLDARINGLNVGRGGGNSVTNISIGQSALLNNTTGLAQIAIGTLALYSASAGSNNNIAIGYTTQYNTTSGYSNVVVGKSGLFSNTVGAVNTAMGNNVMTDNVSGYGNNAFGDGALRTNTIGSENAAFGTHAGRYVIGGANPNRSGSNSIFLGSYTKPLGDGQTNQIVIGYGSVGLGSNTTVLGNSSTTDTWLGGKVLIGTNQTSSYQLRVVGSTDISGSLTTTGSILFPSLTQSPQSNAVLIDTTTGQLYYTASSAIVVTSSISASYAPNIYNSNGILTSDRTVNLSTYTLNFSKSITTNGVTVGTGPANSSTNSVLGFQALNFNTSSIGTVAIGYQAALVASGSSRSVYIGYRTLYEAFAGKTGFQNVYVGGEAGRGANTNYAVFLGAVAGYFTSGSYSIHIGHYAGWQTNGSYNVILGANTAGGLSSGDYNTIIGSQISGLSNISNNIILADGQGNIRARHDAINWDISGSLLPSVTELFDLGSSTRKWKDLYLSGSTIYLGNIQLKEIGGNFVISSLSGNPAFSGSFSGSLFGSSSWATNSLTASSADNFTVRGTLTAQTIVAQVITSSVQYVTGSTQFGSLLSNTHQFTGSVSITGSLSIDSTSPSTILTVGNTSKDNGGITVLSTDSSTNYDIITGQRLYPRIRLIDSNPGGGSTFQMWNLGNQLRFGTNAGSGDTSAININAGNAASVIFNGDVGIKQPSPSYTLDVTGTIRATGDVIAYSDARVKDNVETIENALEKVNALRGVSYTRKDTDDKSRKLGVIAQELLPIIPEAVSKDQHGNYSVSYGNMVGLLIEAIKEQQKQIDELKLLLKK